ncbi:MAG: hypothetical protein V7K94_08170 [Nostoc sp.]|uniref:hypothetical protein n=1 Tax=Nostoc sp. TaxID=1180 RepID=UPI002FF72300
MQNLFKIGRLNANPHYYDYFHSLLFNEDGTVDMASGAGQAIIVTAQGKYSVSKIDRASFSIKFYELIETNSYSLNGNIGDKIRDIDPFIVTVTIEKGTFALEQEVIWNIKNEEEHPCYLFTSRYVFDYDPLSFSKEKSQTNLYYLIEQKEFYESEKYYYPQVECKKLIFKELQELGITPIY